MSIRATDYVLDVAGEAGCVGARFVLLALATRANGSCGCVLGGDWLADVSGLHQGSVRRHLDALAEAGLIDMRRRRGRSHVVRFPTAAFIHNPAHQCAGCDAWKRAAPRAPVRENRAPVRETPRTSARRTYIEPGTRNPAADTGAHAPLSRDERRRLIEDGRKQAHG